MTVRKYCIKRGVALKEGVGLGKNISSGGGGSWPKRGQTNFKQWGCDFNETVVKDLGEELFFFLS